MWILTSKRNGEVYYLFPDKPKHTVGRSNVDLTIKDDSSISRVHACLYPAEDHVIAVDVGSKYGTYYNQNIENKHPMEKNKQIALKNGERIQFGVLDNEWVLSKLQICTITSSLNAEEKDEVTHYMEVLKGKVIDSWHEGCTHLTMSELSVTVKVLYALVECIPIVSIKYWKAYIENLREGKSPPKTQDHLPRIGESFLNSEQLSFVGNEARKSLFSGKTFVFLNNKHYNIYNPIITRAGGQCKGLNKGMQMVSLAKKNVVVVQYIPSPESQSSQMINGISEYMRKKNRRLIPDCEIGLAILHCSTSKYCNPEYEISSELIPESSTSFTCTNIIAEETPLGELPASEFNSDNVVVEETPQEEEHHSKTSAESVVYDVMENTGKNVISEEEMFQFRSLQDSCNESEINSDKIQRDQALISKLAVGEKRKRGDSSEEQKEYKKPHISKDSGHKLTETIEKRVSTLNLDEFINVSKSHLSKSNYVPEKEVTSVERQEKRGRIAIIGDDNEDDLFDFGSMPKKYKPSVVENLPKSSEEKQGASTSSLKHTKSVNDDTSWQRFIKPIEVTSEGWIYPAKIKMEAREKSKIKQELGENDSATEDWINAIKDAFEVRVIPMQITAISPKTSSLNVSLEASKFTGKNFKAFTKKRNYIPQQVVIKTVPFVVSSINAFL